MSITYNINIVGNLINNNGVLSGFSGDNYAKLPELFNPGNSSWEIHLKIKPTSVSSFQPIIGNSNYTYGTLPELKINNSYFQLKIWTTGGSFEVTGSHLLEINTTYYVKIYWANNYYNLDYSTDNTTYTNDISYNSNVPLSNTNDYIGLGVNIWTSGANEGFTGEIDLNGCYITINNNIFWQGVTNNSYTKIQLRRDTASHWSSVNPVLALGEVGIETDTRKQKFGDGSTAWNSLQYSNGDTKQDALTAGNGITITNVSGTLPNNYTGDSALITCDSYESGYPAYYAFDGDNSTYWGGVNTGEHWITRQHNSIIVKSVSVSFREYSERFTQGEIQGSNDGTTFTTIASFSNNENTSIIIDCSSNTTAYTYTRLVGTTTDSGWGKVGEMIISYETPSVISVNSTIARTADVTSTLSDYVTKNTIQYITASKNFSNSSYVGFSNSATIKCFEDAGTHVLTDFDLRGSGSTNYDYPRHITSNSTNITITAYGSTTRTDLIIDGNTLYNGSTGYIPNARLNMDSVPTNTSAKPITSGGVYTALSGKQDTISDLATIRSGASLGASSEQTSNKVTSITSSSTDTQYPSAKCVYDELQTVKRNIGEIVQSTIPLSDAGLHLLDGSLLSGSGTYAEFFNYIASIYDVSSNYFCSEADWQANVATYGVCGKFVYVNTSETYYAFKYNRYYTEEEPDIPEIVYATTENPDLSTKFYYLNNNNEFVEAANVEVIPASNPDGEIRLTDGTYTDGIPKQSVYKRQNNLDTTIYIKTVRLPKITGFTEGTIDATALGSLVEAGLPNIIGNLYNINTWGGAADGAFTVTGTAIRNSSGSGNTTYTNFTLNASASSSIYKDSFNKVQPQSVKVLYYIVVATSTKTDIQVDIDEIATDLNGKADTDLSNITNTGYIKMAGAVMPSTAYIDLTLGASQTLYTAPANGWVMFTQRLKSGSIWASVVDTDKDGLCMSQSNSTSSYNNLNVFLPVKKGDTYKIGYNGTTTSDTANRFVFIYSVGSESEAS